jgi:hypothetical protein
MLPDMSDESPAKPRPPVEAKRNTVVSIADRNQEWRHEAARRLAEKHNAFLRQLHGETDQAR